MGTWVIANRLHNNNNMVTSRLDVGVTYRRALWVEELPRKIYIELELIERFWTPIRILVTTQANAPTGFMLKTSRGKKISMFFNNKPFDRVRLFT